jgi:hypothetical protein
LNSFLRFYFLGFQNLQTSQPEAFSVADAFGCFLGRVMLPIGAASNLLFANGKGKNGGGTGRTLPLRPKLLLALCESGASW